MMSVLETRIQQIVQDIDQLISEMSLLRSQLTELGAPANQTASIRNADYFGMWADREDMRGLSSREWLEKQRTREWHR